KSATARYGHFFSPPGEVSLFCPGEHLPVGFVSGFPLPGPTSTAATAEPLAANVIAAASSAMRLPIMCHPLSWCASGRPFHSEEPKVKQRQRCRRDLADGSPRSV